jgi:hypothetical protein
MNREPVLITAAAAAAVNLVVALGLPIDDAVQNAIIVLVTAVATLFARSKVTPAE